MYHQGPAVLVRFLAGLGATLPDRYTHVCHACGTLLERYSREELLHRIDEYYSACPWRIVFTSRGFDLAGTAHSPVP
jgi:hypothetical protein